MNERDPSSYCEDINMRPGSVTAVFSNHATPVQLESGTFNPPHPSTN